MQAGRHAVPRWSALRRVVELGNYRGERLRRGNVLLVGLRGALVLHPSGAGSSFPTMRSPWAPLAWAAPLSFVESASCSITVAKCNATRFARAATTPT